MKCFRLSVILFVVGAFVLAPVFATAQSDTAKEWFGKGYHEHRQGKYEKAIEFYTKAINTDPNPKYDDGYIDDSYLNRGNCYRALKRYDEAIADYTKAICIDPNFALAYSNRGNVYRDLKRYNEAIVDYTKAISIKPDYDYYYMKRGYAYEDFKRYDEAIADFTKAISIDPNDAYYYLRRGILYDKLERNKEAKADFKKVISIETGDDWRDYTDRGRAYYYLRKYDKAMKDFNNSNSIEETPFNYYCRGLTYKAMGEDEKALADLLKACDGYVEDACEELKK